MKRGMDIDDFVEQFEAEHGSDALVRARQSLARTAYGQGPETFTRLRLAAGKSVRQVLKALPSSLVIAEDDIAQATFDVSDERLLQAVAGIVGVDRARLSQAVLAERALRVDWKRDVTQHPLAGAVGLVRATSQ
jgi:hypothetical protein